MFKRMKFIFQKDEGNFVDFVTIMIAILAVMVVAVAYIGWVGNLHDKNKIDDIAREYLLRMEVEGYLTDSDHAELINDLNDIDVSSVSISGTTRTPLSYGEKITIKITGEITVQKINLLSSLSIQKTTEQVPFSVTKSSTAKN